MGINTSILTLLTVFFAFCFVGHGVHAFGAGNIPSFAYLEGKAFRHGDIEDTLAEMFKKAGVYAIASLVSKGSKFGPLDIKRVYFGNWLRDFSQAVDIATLKKLPHQTIINLCMILGFMAHGYATHEFEVTKERLGVYLPTEHIDNPRGYGAGEDPRKYNPNLRGPIDPRELHIDPRTGMKNYIANESGPWDTSKALVRRTLERCIYLGRQYFSSKAKQDLYESYRLLGQALHTLEDFPAHSNFCELALVYLGHLDVFVHVGDQVRVKTPDGKWVAPLVTGTFGSNDFYFSLIGEATDHISEASVTDLNKAFDKARSKSVSTSSASSFNASAILRNLLFKLPGGDSGEMRNQIEDIERISAGPAQGGKRPEDMSPQEVHAVLWQVLTFRDSVMKKIEITIEKVPGLAPLIEKFHDAISVLVFTTLEPFIKPVMRAATEGLQNVSGEVINTHDQYEVFNDSLASDPTHSFLSKDHFSAEKNLILNEPAGHLAKIIVAHTVNWVLKAWDDTSLNVRQATEDILQCLFHPDFHDPNSKVQREMMQYMSSWVRDLGNRRPETLHRLTKQAVRNHENIRFAGDGGMAAAQGTFAYNEGIQMQHVLQGYAVQIPGVSQAQTVLSSTSAGPPISRMDTHSSNFLTPTPTMSSYGGSPSAYPSLHQSTQSPASVHPPDLSGDAASYYRVSQTVTLPNEDEGQTGSPYASSSVRHATPSATFSQQSTVYAPPPGPPPSYRPQSSAYAPPPGAAPSFYPPPSLPTSFIAFTPSPPRYPQFPSHHYYHQHLNEGHDVVPDSLYPHHAPTSNPANFNLHPGSSQNDSRHHHHHHHQHNHRR